MRYARWLCLVSVPVLVVAAGCRDSLPLGEVDGVITMDGQPLPEVLITFVPEAAGNGTPVRSMAVSDDEGRYRLQAETLVSGAVLGEHRVIVEDLAVLKAPRTEDGTVITHPPNRFPSHYSDPLKSPLRATVDDASQHIPLELHSTVDGLP
jgi:hypothetical protein